MLDAVYMAMKDSKWREPGQAHRFIVVFTDADSKPMHEGVVEAGEDTSAGHLKQLLIKERIKLYGVLPKHDRYKELFGILPGAIMIEIGEPGEEETNKGLKNQDFKQLLNLIARTITESSGKVVS